VLVYTIVTQIRAIYTYFILSLLNGVYSVSNTTFETITRTLPLVVCPYTETEHQVATPSRRHSTGDDVIVL